MAATLRSAMSQHGYCIVRQLMSPYAAWQWKATIAERLQKTGKDKQSSGVVVWTLTDLPTPLLYEVISGAIPALATEIFASRYTEFLSAKPVIKDQSRRFPTPFHADHHYWHGSPKISLWLALDRAHRGNGCLRLVQDSHKREDFQTMDVAPQTAQKTGFVHRIDDQVVATSGLPVLDVELEAGDALWFSDRMVHASHGNTSSEPRWAFISTYRDAAVPDTATIWPGGGVLVQPCPADKTRAHRLQTAKNSSGLIETTW